MRLEIAKLLTNNPNFLILDEPTNHLDLPSLIWLEQYLKSFRGTLLFVSHDKEFINNLADKIMHFSNGNINVYNGNFDSFLMQKEMNVLQKKKEKDNIQKQRDHLQSFIDRFRFKASKAKQAQSKLKELKRLQELEDRIDIDDPEKCASFKLNIAKQSGKVILDIKNAAIGYEDILCKNINLRIIRGNKIAVIGSNGIGKSTLLKSIIGEIPIMGGEATLGSNVNIGYYAQDQTEFLDPDLDALENVLKLAPTVKMQEARTLLAYLLITKENVKKRIGTLSGGEKRKVAMAALLGRRCNFLVLDEPTNHLDMSSIEALARAFVLYEGTILTVSHNRTFIDSFATHLLKMERRGSPELIEIN
jgi:ATP-binding cassette subfamily F protein 3